jgi:hypothetical protein
MSMIRVEDDDDEWTLRITCFTSRFQRARGVECFASRELNGEGVAEGENISWKLSIMKWKKTKKNKGKNEKEICQVVLSTCHSRNKRRKHYVSDAPLTYGLIGHWTSAGTIFKPVWGKLLCPACEAIKAVFQLHFIHVTKYYLIGISESSSKNTWGDYCRLWQPSTHLHAASKPLEQLSDTFLPHAAFSLPFSFHHYIR